MFRKLTIIYSLLPFIHKGTEHLISARTLPSGVWHSGKNLPSMHEVLGLILSTKGGHFFVLLYTINSKKECKMKINYISCNGIKIAKYWVSGAYCHG